MADTGPGSVVCLRQELREFAQSLDEATRAEILAALDHPPSAPEIAAPGGAVPEPAALDTVAFDPAAHAAAGLCPSKPAASPQLPLPGALPLADLSRILLRLSHLVTRQEARLMALFQELQQAIRQQDVLEALQQELAVARRLQQSVLPRQAPALEGIELDALMEPASEVGGDFYDYFMIDDDHLALVVGDVAGKGVPAAFFMAIARTLLRAHALTLREPARVMAALNEQLCAENDSAMFVTLVFAVLHVPSGRLHCINAGHQPPLLQSASRPTRALRHGCNPAIGIQPGVVFEVEQFQLLPGDLLLVYTDGIIEARDPQGQEFGAERLHAALAASQRTADSLPQALLARVRRFECQTPTTDDITCLALRYRRRVRSSGSRLSRRR